MSSLDSVVFVRFNLRASDGPVHQFDLRRVHLRGDIGVVVAVAMAPVRISTSCMICTSSERIGWNAPHYLMAEVVGVRGAHILEPTAFSLE